MNRDRDSKYIELAYLVIKRNERVVDEKYY